MLNQGGVFVSPQSSKPHRGEQFDSILCGSGKSAFSDFRLVATSVLGYAKVGSEKQLVGNLLLSNEQLG
jgi:hypothetical protein